MYASPIGAFALEKNIFSYKFLRCDRVVIVISVKVHSFCSKEKERVCGYVKVLKSRDD